MRTLTREEDCRGLIDLRRVVLLETRDLVAVAARYAGNYSDESPFHLHGTLREARRWKVAPPRELPRHHTAGGLSGQQQVMGPRAGPRFDHFSAFRGPVRELPRRSTAPVTWHDG
ncbi:MAG: hypothetical protein P8Z74_20780, partial [Acidobacteriota bacterium]